jgi:hypothetical protein
MLRDRLSDYSAPLRAQSMQIALELGMTLIYVAVGGFATLVAFAYRRPVVGSILGLGGFVLLFPVLMGVESLARKIVPGFAVYRGAASWIVRNSAEVTFVSLIVGIVGLVLGCIALFRRPGSVNGAPGNDENRLAQRLAALGGVQEMRVMVERTAAPSVANGEPQASVADRSVSAIDGNDADQRPSSSASSD